MTKHSEMFDAFAREYNRGYYQAMDDVMNWINSQELIRRQDVYKFCLERKP